MKLNVLGCDIFYEVHNSDKKKAVVFIHGNSHDHKSFSLQAESPLYKNYKIVCLDLPGHGKSEPLEKYSPIILAQVVHEFLSLLKLENAALVGHSLGGHVILHLLKSFSPKAIFVYGAPPLKRPLDMSGFKDCPEAQAIFMEEVTDEQRNDLLYCLYRDPNSDPFIAQSFRETDSKFRSQILEALTSGEYYDETELLNELNAPKALIAAENDKIVDTLYIEKSVDSQKLWKQKAQRISGAHNLHRDNPEEFNDALLEFLNDIDFS